MSRRLDDDERERLKAICKGLELPEGGIIVRTAAEGASEEELSGDLAFLRKLWSTIQGRAGAREGAHPRLSRGRAAAARRPRSLPARLRAPRRRPRAHVPPDRRRTSSGRPRSSPGKVEWYRETDSLMESSGVEAAVRSTLDRRVDLPSGGYLVFDYAEAFTVIDVNTGRFVGSRGEAPLRGSRTRSRRTTSRRRRRSSASFACGTSAGSSSSTSSTWRTRRTGRRSRRRSSGSSSATVRRPTSSRSRRSASSR